MSEETKEEVPVQPLPGGFGGATSYVPTEAEKKEAERIKAELGNDGTGIAIAAAEKAQEA